MDKLIVSIANSSDAPLTIFGRNRICVPGSGNTQVELPDNPQTSALLTRLRREYPFLDIRTSTADVSAPARMPVPEPESVKPEQTSQQEKTDSGGGKPKNTHKTEATAG